MLDIHSPLIALAIYGNPKVEVVNLAFNQDVNLARPAAQFTRSMHIVAHNGSWVKPL
jgi:hypothetical protein